MGSRENHKHDQRLKNITTNKRFIEVNLFSLEIEDWSVTGWQSIAHYMGGKEFIVRILLKAKTKSKWGEKGNKYMQVRKKAQIYNGEDN